MLLRTRISKLNCRVATSEGDVDETYDIKHVGHTVGVDIGLDKGAIGIGINKIGLPAEGDIDTLDYIKHVGHTIAGRISMAIAGASTAATGCFGTIPITLTGLIVCTA